MLNVLLDRHHMYMASSHANKQFLILKLEGKIVDADSSGIIHVEKLLWYFAWPVPVTLLRVYRPVYITIWDVLPRFKVAF